MFKGFYPPVYDQKVQPQDWLANYYRAYIERDVRQVPALLIVLCSSWAGLKGEEQRTAFSFFVTLLCWILQNTIGLLAKMLQKPVEVTRKPVAIINISCCSADEYAFVGINHNARIQYDR